MTAVNDDATEQNVGDAWLGVITAAAAADDAASP